MTNDASELVFCLYITVQPKQNFIVETCFSEQVKCVTNQKSSTLTSQILSNSLMNQ